MIGWHRCEVTTETERTPQSKSKKSRHRESDALIGKDGFVLQIKEKSNDGKPIPAKERAGPVDERVQKVVSCELRAACIAHHFLLSR